MNAREFLVTTVHEIAISTEFAMTARASEEADTDALTNRPALYARAQGIDPPDNFVPGDARPADWKGGFHRAGIRVADTARFHANTHLTGARVDKRFHYSCEFSRFRYLDCLIHCAHSASLKALAATVAGGQSSETAAHDHRMWQLMCHDPHASDACLCRQRSGRASLNRSSRAATAQLWSASRQRASLLRRWLLYAREPNLTDIKGNHK